MIPRVAWSPTADRPGLTAAMAEQYCQENGLGYCRVTGELTAEIPCKSGTIEPDFDKQVDYDNLN